MIISPTSYIKLFLGIGVMKILNNAVINVFCKEGEDENHILGKLKAFVPFDLEKEKIAVQRRIAIGFEDKKIIILEATLLKERHTTPFIISLLEHLSKEQKELLLSQAESRLDEGMHFFIRFDKDRWLDEGALEITEDGNCFHVKMNIAVYPAKREKALEVVRGFLRRE